MKKYLLSLVCAALASTAWAENGVTTLTLPSPSNVTQVNATTTTAVMNAASAGTAAHGCRSGDCCPQTKTVCVSQPTTVVKTKVLFSSGCETVCHNCMLSFLKKGGNCETCATGNCGGSYVRRDLYKRVEKTECPSYKCVPTQVPVCTTPKCATPKCATPCATGCSTCGNGTCSAAPVVTGTAPAAAMTPAAPVAPTTAALAITTPPAPVSVPMPVVTPVSTGVR